MNSSLLDIYEPIFSLQSNKLVVMNLAEQITKNDNQNKALGLLMQFKFCIRELVNTNSLAREAEISYAGKDELMNLKKDHKG